VEIELCTRNYIVGVAESFSLSVLQVVCTGTARHLSRFFQQWKIKLQLTGSIPLAFQMLKLFLKLLLLLLGDPNIVMDYFIIFSKSSSSSRSMVCVPSSFFMTVALISVKHRVCCSRY
jgi:hypothetical protein